MHELSIKLKDGINIEELWHVFYAVLGSMRQNGQMEGREMSPFLHADRATAVVTTVSEEAMNPKYYNKYVKKHIEDLEAFCGNPLEIKFSGFREGEETGFCKCTEHAHFVLHYHNDFSPIICGSCEKAYPLFKLPQLEDFSYWRTMAWMSTYQACVLLDLNCGTGEKWAIRQQSDPNSGLSKQGREVTAKIRTETGVKTYYFIANYAKRSRAKDMARPCPSCGGAWHLEIEIHRYFHFKCDNCLLMSAYSNNHN
jgi:predicted  nucleic acid-binding Zn ribbon protein